jgi:hypothetical protein
VRHEAWALAVVVAALGAAALVGAHRTGALLGAGISGATGLLSMRAMARFAGRARKPVQQALAVVALGFLVRLLLVALGTVLVVKTGQSVAGFVSAFFVVYFVLAGIEGAYVQHLGRRIGASA